MDVVGDAERGRGHSADESLSGIESKKHRMNTGQDSEGFSKRYQLLEQLGSGASGTVWKCRLNPGHARRGGDEPLEGVIYAAKIIDLRPFKLRERFSMQRLLREVNIMRRLRHPNIIRLVEALDSAEQLVLVLEYAPGVELFDAILSKHSFSEEEARPVFVQVARALQYMHSMQIVHRDVKPENVMIIDRPSPVDNLYPEAKLLDFGLSKAIDADGGGSVARTFVGTPSYLAPEVEEKAGGRGKPYGTPVDCWSLGAMLYVMLVARFPEFQVQGVRKYVRMHGPLWDKVSSEAKELIQHLMAFDPGARLTVDKALRHPWLRELAEKEPMPLPPSLIQRMPSGVKGMSPLPENMAFSVPAAVMTGYSLAPAVAAARGSALDSPGPRPLLTDTGGSGGGGWGPWGSGKAPIVTEQETPPANRHNKKSFEFSPSGPTIRELHSDESPLSSVDSGMGEKIEDNNGQATGGNPGTNFNDNDNGNGNKNNNDNSNNVRGMDNGMGSSGGGNQSRMSYEKMKERETAMVAWYDGAQGMGITMPPDGGVPLLQLQNRITACLETAVTTYSDCPEAAASLRRSAALCRESLRESVTLLRKIERTAAQVLTLFPDLALAVEEGEPELAHDFFSTVKGWVREMYTAVSLVQAKNSANAKQVGEAMERHAEMGLDARKRQQHQHHQQQQKQRARQEVGGVGGARGVGVAQPRDASGGGRAMGGYVARNTGAAVGLSGDLETDAARQGDLIAVDPETFEVVRQIQALRNSLSGAEPAGADGAPGTGSAASASGTVEALSDEKLINLFLLMARGPKFLPHVPTGAGTDAEARAGGGTRNGEVPPSASRGDGKPAHGEGLGAGRQSDNTEKVGREGEVMSGVEAMFAVHTPDATVGWSASLSPIASTATSDDTRMANLTAQMSIEDGGFGGVAVKGGGATPATNTGDKEAGRSSGGGMRDVGGDGGNRQQEGTGAGKVDDGQELLWDGHKEHELQLARTHGDKVYTEVQRALQMLHEVDSVLEQLALFWANSEVIFDVLLRKGDLVEKFVAFANKPRLLQRFTERLADYKRFWQGVQGVCNKYVCGQLNCSGCANGPSGAGGSGSGSGATYASHDRSPSASSSAEGGAFGRGSAAGTSTANQSANSEGGGSKQSSTASGMSMGMGMSGAAREGQEGMMRGVGVGRQGLGGAGGWANVEMGMDAHLDEGGSGRGGM